MNLQAARACPRHLSLQIYWLMCAGAASRLCAIIYIWPVRAGGTSRDKGAPICRRANTQQAGSHTSDTYGRCLNKRPNKSQKTHCYRLSHDSPVTLMGFFFFNNVYFKMDKKNNTIQTTNDSHFKRYLVSTVRILLKLFSSK